MKTAKIQGTDVKKTPKKVTLTEERLKRAGNLSVGVDTKQMTASMTKTASSQRKYPNVGKTRISKLTIKEKPFPSPYPVYNVKRSPKGIKETSRETSPTSPSSNSSSDKEDLFMTPESIRRKLESFSLEQALQKSRSDVNKLFPKPPVIREMSPVPSADNMRGDVHPLSEKRPVSKPKSPPVKSKTKFTAGVRYSDLSTLLPEKEFDGSNDLLASRYGFDASDMVKRPTLRSDQSLRSSSMKSSFGSGYEFLETEDIIHKFKNKPPTAISELSKFNSGVIVPTRPNISVKSPSIPSASNFGKIAFSGKDEIPSNQVLPQTSLTLLEQEALKSGLDIFQGGRENRVVSESKNKRRPKKSSEKSLSEVYKESMKSVLQQQPEDKPPLAASMNKSMTGFSSGTTINPTTKKKTTKEEKTPKMVPQKATKVKSKTRKSINPSAGTAV